MTPFRANTTGNNIIIPGSAGQVIQVVAMFFQANVATSFKLVDGTSGADLTGLMTFPTGGGFNFPVSSTVLFTTSAGEGLNLKISGLVGDVGGGIIFSYV